MCEATYLGEYSQLVKPEERDFREDAPIVQTTLPTEEANLMLK